MRDELCVRFSRSRNHLSHVIPATDLEPASHAVQELAELDSATKPGAHSSQLLEPEEAACLPGPHASQLALPSSLDVPGSQGVQSARESWKDSSVPVSVRNLPAGHMLHSEPPGNWLKLPAVQMEQALAPAELMAPAGQIEQSSTESCRAGEVAASCRYLRARNRELGCPKWL